MRRFVLCLLSGLLSVTVAACGGKEGSEKNDLCAKKVCTGDRVCDPSDGFCKLRNGGTGGGTTGSGGGVTGSGGGDMGTGGGVTGSGGGVTGSGGGDIGTGGGFATGGSVGTGGGLATGGSVGTGGGLATGGSVGTGGGLATGGSVGTGGGFATGGSIGTGGGFATGGSVGTGGGFATGGSIGTGGGLATGGSIGTGGGFATGGSIGTGGGFATGGSVGTGGGFATGGSIGTGGGFATGGGTGTGGGVITDGGSDLGLVGTACNNDNDCAKSTSGLSCRKHTSPGDAGYQGGYCTRNCSTQNACNGIDSFCFGIPPEYGEAQPMCVALCDTAQDCRVGYACYDIGAAQGACWLDPLPPVADAGSFDAGPTPNTVGNACVQTAQCQNPPSTGVFCYPEQIAEADGGTSYSGFPGGYCMRDCTSGLDCSTNGSAACITGLSDTYDLCAQLCTYKTDGGTTGCRGNYACQPLQGADGGISPQGYCWTRCDDPVWGGCAQGQTCLPSGACR